MSRDALAAALPPSAASVSLAFGGRAALGLGGGGGGGAGALGDGGAGFEPHEEFDLAMTQMHRDLTAMYKARWAALRVRVRAGGVSRPARAPAVLGRSA
jgi:hypothetical protein